MLAYICVVSIREWPRTARTSSRQAYRAAQGIVDRVRTSLRHPDLRAGFERLSVIHEIAERTAPDG